MQRIQELYPCGLAREGKLMSKKRTALIALCIVVFLLAAGFIALFITAQEPYVYPIASDSAEWKEMMFQERCEACRIPQYKLWFMSTEHLLDATLDHPLVITLDIFDKPSQGIEFARNISDAYCVLLKRSDAKDVILERYLELFQDDENIAHVLDGYLLRDLLLYDPILSEQLTLEEKEWLENQPSLRSTSEKSTEDPFRERNETDNNYLY